ncbi:MAG: hypothetical protein FRX49_01766 [Trebouxia sp. A1-2]|nr:MAG: hypothetical protein FRX49_01766 [Trebouxia sp. A1-2]
MQGLHDAALPSAVGKSSCVDLTDDVSDTDLEMQQAMEASLLENFCPGTEDTVSPEMHAQQQELLLFYARQQAACISSNTETQNPADTAIKSQSAHLQQQKWQPADWHTGAGVMSEQGHKDKAGMLKTEADSEQDATLKLTLSQECSDESTSSAGVSLPAQQLPGRGLASALETPAAMETRVPAFGEAQTGQTITSRLVTWPTAASKLMTAAPIKQLPHRTHLGPSTSLPQAPPASPVSSGSAGFFSNKRQKLGTLEPPPGLWLGSRGRRSGLTPMQASHRVTTHQRQGYSDPPAEQDTNLESDADTDAATHGSGGRSEGSNDRSSAPGLSHSLGALFDQQVPTHTGSLSDHDVGIDSAGDTEAGYRGVSEFVDRQVPGGNGASDGQPFQLIQDKGKGIAGPSPEPSFLPEQPSKLDHTKPGNWVWWKVDDNTWMPVQVQKRFRDWAGLLESYQVLLIDEGTEDVPVEVPAEQVCMHFFPGSRVDIKGTPAQQGEVLPIRYHPFHGIYNVRMDEGCVLMVRHCDMRLLHNHAEASSWAVGPGDIAHSLASVASQHGPNAQQLLHEQAPVQQPGVCTGQQHGKHLVPMSGFEGRAHVRQGVVAQDTHSAAKSAFVDGASSDLTALVNIARAMTQPAAAAAAATVSVGMLPDSAAQGTAARSGMVDNADDEEEGEHKSVCPPQRRRTKQSVAQRMAPKRATPDVPASPLEPRSTHWKQSHAGHAKPAEPSIHIAAPGPVKLLPELPSHAAAVKAEAPIRIVSSAEGSHSHVTQQAPRQQVNSWDHDSDDDLFVDLSGCNIVPTNGRKKQPADESAATDSKQSAQTGGISIAGTDSAVASSPIASARKGIASSVMSPTLCSQSGKGRRASAKGRKLAQEEDDHVVLDLD